jgi:glycosyltransferase involved in cell wall biosynthesis
MKVSVLVLAYNQEPFVAQAVRSALEQDAGVNYEIVVGEDASTDRTREILTAIEREHRDRIRLLLPVSNRGMYENFVETLRACTGEYVALLEGDDYWTSPRKLRTQAAYLDAHPQCALCFHNVSVVHADSSRPPRLYCDPRPKDRSTLEDILARNFIPTASVMVRRVALGEPPVWMRSLRMLDWPLHVLSARHGDIGYLDEVMAVYRIHAGGIWSGAGHVRKLEEELAIYGPLAAELGRGYRPQLQAGIGRRCFDLAWVHAEAGDGAAARRYAWRSVRERPLNPLVARRELAKLLLKLYVPALHRFLYRVVGAIRA